MMVLFGWELERVVVVSVLMVVVDVYLDARPDGAVAVVVAVAWCVD